jgi:hypothetical protein
VEEDDGVAASHVDIADLGVEDLDAPARQLIGSGRFLGCEYRVAARRVAKSDAGRQAAEQHSGKSTAREGPAILPTSGWHVAVSMDARSAGHRVLLPIQ